MTTRLTCLFLILPGLLFSQQKIFVNGYVEDSKSGERLIGAVVYDPITHKSTVTNQYGYFNLACDDSASTLLEVRFLGYEVHQQKIDPSEDYELTIRLIPSELELASVTITEDRFPDTTRFVSKAKISPKEIEQMPLLLGETDVLKALQLLPGIQGGTEGSSGLYVRGGSPDQNLILIDGVPVYNTSHLFGFFSVFNNDAINDVQIWKGGFPARFGERLSSVIDITLKEGNNQKLSGQGSIGLLSSKFMLEGPIGSEKTSFMISGRRTYFDLFTSAAQNIADPGGGTTGYFFHDFNVKINHRLSFKDRLHISFFGGKDAFFHRENYDNENEEDSTAEDIDVGLNWGNIIGVFRWNRVISPKLLMNASASYSRYNFQVFERYGASFIQNDELVNLEESSEYQSGIEDWSFKLDLDWSLSHLHQLQFGLNLTNHTYRPGAFQQSSQVQPDTTFGALKLNGLEVAGYGELTHQIGKKTNLNLGIRYSGYAIRQQYFSSIQPRLNVRHQLKKHLSIHGAYAEMRQFIHLLTNSGVGLPTDLWVPATDRAKPQSSRQLSLGVLWDKGPIDFSLDGYFKTMENVISYRDGATFFNAANDWEDKIVAGEGRSMGVEVLIRKSTGKTTGWIGYTLSNTNRRFDELNFGRSFPFRYDRRHDISLVINHEWRKGATLSFNWIFQSGNHVSIPTSFQPSPIHFFRRYGFAQQNRVQLLPSFNDFVETGSIGLVQYFPDRNNYRLRPTHRLDIGVRFSKRKKRGIRTWSFGFYNAYSRQNPFYVNWEYNRQGDLQLVQQSLLPILPYFSYGFKF